MEPCRKNLVSGLDQLGLSISEQQIDLLLAFIQLIEKWNKAYNLTSIRNKDEMVTLHLLDSLSVLPYVKGSRIIDCGTGAGLPGLPLAICLPEYHFTLLDSNAKKTRFVQQAILELKLKNVSIHQSRVEDYQPEERFDCVITRAFTHLSEMISLTAHLLADDGVLLAMKGQHPEQELAAVKAKTKVIPLVVPGLAAERCLVQIETATHAEVL
ncbi:16S rRNA (guanine(527)-N(7))-methyltransferase RsmG [Methylicorpusculum sp.]|uniref:16S rRNA (guanine(527)-N(7))-methyltransferase RsmG n=1 Tax=Methylicorpusculum sp. TaxID=2713644 RepID=UPI002728D3BB|nr:16S rRNA (guanine(527)-N(7))-methyltransferase RsmG [Methylicorpusculum sp.]MDO8845288.1 16S rRNA (guanine(527)-N(7))-methyltransferase RsmG [Methylicorpusculum sp.]